MRRPALALSAYVVLAAVAGPRRIERGPVLCPFRRLTGRRCPACGLTRSVAALARGDLRGAAARHPLGPVLVLLLAGWWSSRLR